MKKKQIIMYSLLLLLFVMLMAFLYYHVLNTREYFTNYTPVNVSGYKVNFQKDGLSRDLNSAKRNTGESINDFLTRCKSLCPGAMCKGFVTDFNPNASDPSSSINTCWIKGVNSNQTPSSTLSSNPNRITYLKN
jgi:hypothetical protein